MEENIATNEDIAEILVTEKVRIQKHKVRNPVVKSRAIRVARVVATPFPPLKLRYIG